MVGDSGGSSSSPIVTSSWAGSNESTSPLTQIAVVMPAAHAAVPRKTRQYFMGSPYGYLGARGAAEAAQLASRFMASRDVVPASVV